MLGTIVKIEDDSYDGRDFKKVTLSDGSVLKVKYGRGGSLKAKWGELAEGTTYEWEMGDFNGKPFVLDFQVTSEGQPVPAETPPEPTAKAQMSTEMWAEKDKRQRQSIERQVSMKCAIEFGKDKPIEEVLIMADKIAQWISGSGEIPTTQKQPTQKTNTAPNKPFIDLDWLQQSMEKLEKAGNKAYSRSSMATYLKSAYEVQGASISAQVSKLTEGQANQLKAEINSSLSGLEKEEK